MTPDTNAALIALLQDMLRAQERIAMSLAKIAAGMDRRDVPGTEYRG